MSEQAQIWLALIIQAITLVWFVHSKLRTRKLRATLHRVEQSVRDADNGMLTLDAMRMRAAYELQWARNEALPVGLVIVECPDGPPMGVATRKWLRTYELPYRVDDNKIAVLLWNVDRESAVKAHQRIVDAANVAGIRTRHAGLAMFPDDGTSLDALLQHARGITGHS